MTTPDSHLTPAISHQVSVLPDGLHFTTDGVASVLESGLQAGVEMPSSCRNGTCRECMCRLVSGNVRYRIDWPGLSADEKAEGWFLPCVALAQSDLQIEQPFAQAR
jgi:ferredoxin